MGRKRQTKIKGSRRAKPSFYLKMGTAPVKSMTDEEKEAEYLKGEMNAWKYASLDRRMKVGL